MKKMLSMILALALCAGCLTACGESNSSDAASSESSLSAETTTTAEDSSSESEAETTTVTSVDKSSETKTESTTETTADSSRRETETTTTENESSSEAENETTTTTTTQAENTTTQATTQATTEATTAATTKVTSKATTKATTASNVPSLKVVKTGYCGINGGKNLNYTLYSNGLLSISGKGKMMQSGTMQEYWDERNMPFVIREGICEKVKSIIINKGVTTVGKCQFMYCENLKKVSLSNTITTIEGMSLCCKISEVNIPTSVKSIETGALCSDSLKSLTVPSSVVHLGEDNGFILPVFDSNTVIKGKSGSAVEKYAIQNGNKFVAI